MSPQQQRCLELAELAVGLSDPNPRVGCVIVTRDGQVAEGHTHEAGGPHAEAHALSLAKQKGLNLAGSTAWVSLEPCCHHGLTPPCSQALIAAGIGHVEVACLDPNPLVAGQGVEQLRQAGITVNLDSDEWSLKARQLNIGFISRMVRAKPWVRMKIAASLDGTTALENGASQWITGPAARADGHAWRRRAGALLTGIGTVRDDDPRLDVRLVPTARQPLRVVVDSKLSISPQARILQPPGQCLIYTTQDQHHPHWRALAALEGVEIAQLPVTPSGTSAPGASAAKNDLAALLTDLARRGVNELHLEAGEKLNGSFIREGLVDELLVYLAPRLLGRGRGLAAIHDAPLLSLDQDLALSFLETAAVGPDLRVRALTRQGQAFWPTFAPDAPGS
jgi:diaminohydroxyphosphoribosylaminopyrimidine deaminase/5-amino-6-(5-phosphoribosylamino)uracil reductase